MSTSALLGIVAGSGIAIEGLLDDETHRMPFGGVPGLRAGSAEGHSHVFVHGSHGGYRVVLQCGRLHLYEGLSYAEVVRPVDVLHHAGVRTILFTNAAGGLLPEMEPGDLLAVDRVLRGPCRYWPEDPCSTHGLEPEVLLTDYRVPGCAFTGAYYWVPGPCYETRAEIAMMQRLGASAVGMSAAPELKRCRELGIRAGIVSCVTNSCCRPQVLTHAQVLNAARAASQKLADTIRRAIPAIME